MTRSGYSVSRILKKKVEIKLWSVVILIFFLPPYWLNQIEVESKLKMDIVVKFNNNQLFQWGKMNIIVISTIPFYFIC
jgi:hypothetical protein